MRYVPSICRSFHWIAVPHCSIDPSRPCASEACLWRLAVVSSMGVFLRMPDAGKGHSVCRQHRQKTASIRLSTPGPLRSPSMILGSCSPLLPSCVGAGTGPPSSRLPSRHANGVPARASFSSPLRARRKRSCLYRGLPSTTVFSSRNPSRRVRRLEKEASRSAARSLLAECQPTTWSFVQATNITTSRPSHIPSTNTTRCASPHAGATGQSSQNREARRRKVRAGIPISAWPSSTEAGPGAS